MRAFLIATTAAAALALAGCSGTNDNTTPSATEEANAGAAIDVPSGDASGATAEAGMATGAQGFVDNAAASDQFEIESSKLAQTMAKDAAVKDFAAMMVKDHTKSSTELKAAAAKATPAVTVAPKLTSQQQSDLDALKSAGANFDKLYAQKQVAAHTQALALLQGYAATGDAAPLKDFASKTAPVVSKHLDHAKKLPQ